MYWKHSGWFHSTRTTDFVLYQRFICAIKFSLNQAGLEPQLYFLFLCCLCIFLFHIYIYHDSFILLHCNARLVYILYSDFTSTGFVVLPCLDNERRVYIYLKEDNSWYDGMAFKFCIKQSGVEPAWMFDDSSRSRWRSVPAPPPPTLVKHSTLWSRAHSRRSVRPTHPNSVVLPRDDIKSSVFGVL